MSVTSKTGMRYCMGFDIDFAAKRPFHSLAGLFRFVDGQPMPPAAVVAMFALEKAKGREVITPACDNTDAKGQCQGHAVEGER